MAQRLKPMEDARGQQAQRIAELEKKVPALEADLASLRLQTNRANGAPPAAGAVPLSVSASPAEVGKGASPPGDFAALQKRVEDLRAEQLDLLRKEIAGTLVARETAVLEHRQLLGQISRQIDQALKKQEDLARDLARARSSKPSDSETLARLVRQIPEMDRELSGLRSAVRAREKELRDRQGRIESAGRELRNREDRLVRAKAEKTTALLGQVREEVRRAAERAQRTTLAEEYIEQQLYEEAEKEYQRILERQPDEAETHRRLGLLYLQRLGNPKKAAEHLGKYLQSGPAPAEAQRVRALASGIEGL
jgi:tetratricopeptide (TPR) repeat protein